MSAKTTTTEAGSAIADVHLTASKELTLPTAVLAIDAHPDGKRLFASCFDGGVYEVTIDSGERKQIGKHTSFASGIQFAPKANRLISAGYDGALQWFAPAEGKQIRVLDAHKFWSWKMRVSPNEKLIATVTGQFLAGGYKYEPLPEREPSVKVFDLETGRTVWEFPHIPPTLSVAFSPDSRHLAAGNMMGEVRVWDLSTGKQVATWTTPDFTSWGIIKSHHYLGGIFDMTFSPDGRELLVCGMGPMIDPMAGNGKQTWQRFAWSEKPPRKVQEIREGDAGTGLMETLRFHPSGQMFLMAGRLAQGKWNVALFGADSGQLLSAIDTRMRVTDSAWLNGGSLLALAGATSQEKPKNGRYPDFGHIKLYAVQIQKA